MFQPSRRNKRKARLRMGMSAKAKANEGEDDTSLTAHPRRPQTAGRTDDGSDKSILRTRGKAHRGGAQAVVLVIDPPHHNNSLRNNIAECVTPRRRTKKSW